MADIVEIELNRVHFRSHHGVFDQERRLGNEFVVTVKVCVPVSEAMLADRLEGTVSYADLYATVKKVMETPARTLEYVALTIARRLKEEFPTIDRGEVAVTKVQPPICGFDGEATVTARF